MGLDNTVTTIYRARTAEAEAAVKRLRGTEREEAKKTLDSLNQYNAKLGDQISLLTKVGAVAGLAAGGLKLAQAGAKAYFEDTRLEAAAAGVSVEKLTAATRGLVEHDKLLEFAGKAQHGVWKLTETQMVTVAKGTEVLAKRMGVDLQTAMDAVTESVTKGTTRSLKDLGLEVKNETEFMRAMDTASRGAGSSALNAAEKYQQASVAWKDAVDDLMGAIGKLAVQLGPMIQLLAKGLQGLLKFGDELTDRWTNLNRATNSGRSSSQLLRQANAMDLVAKTIGPDIDREPIRMQVEKMGFSREWIREMTDVGADQLRRDAQHYREVATRAFVKETSGDFKTIATTATEAVRKQRKPLDDMWKVVGNLRQGELDETFESWRKLFLGINDLKLTKSAGHDFEFSRELPGVDVGKLIDEQRAQAEAARQKQLQAAGFRSLDEAGTGDKAAAESMAAQFKSAHEELDAMVETFTALNDAATSRNQSILESMFGTPAEFDLYLVKFQALGAGFNVFTSAAAAGMDALITGQKAFAVAVEEAIADALRSLASQALVEALKHTAMAFGAIAIGGPFAGASAAMHFKAAAIWGATAVAAGVAAHAMGQHTGQWSGGGGGGAGSSDRQTSAALGGTGGIPSSAAGGGGGSRGGETQPIVIVLGPEYGAMTERQRRIAMANAYRRGQLQVTRTRNIR